MSFEELAERLKACEENEDAWSTDRTLFGREFIKDFVAYAQSLGDVEAHFKAPDLQALFDRYLKMFKDNEEEYEFSEQDKADLNHLGIKFPPDWSLGGFLSWGYSFFVSPEVEEVEEQKQTVNEKDKAQPDDASDDGYDSDESDYDTDVGDDWFDKLPVAQHQLNQRDERIALQEKWRKTILHYLNPEKNFIGDLLEHLSGSNVYENTFIHNKPRRNEAVNIQKAIQTLVHEANTAFFGASFKDLPAVLSNKDFERFDALKEQVDALVKLLTSLERATFVGDLDDVMAQEKEIFNESMQDVLKLQDNLDGFVRYIAIQSLKAIINDEGIDINDEDKFVGYLEKLGVALDEIALLREKLKEPPITNPLDLKIKPVGLDRVLVDLDLTKHEREAFDTLLGEIKWAYGDETWLEEQLVYYRDDSNGDMLLEHMENLAFYAEGSHQQQLMDERMESATKVLAQIQKLSAVMHQNFYLRKR